MVDLGLRRFLVDVAGFVRQGGVAGMEAWVPESNVAEEVCVWQETRVGKVVVTAASWVDLEVNGDVCVPAWMRAAGEEVCVCREHEVEDSVEVAASRGCIRGEVGNCGPASSSSVRWKGIGDCTGEAYPESLRLVGVTGETGSGGFVPLSQESEQDSRPSTCSRDQQDGLSFKDDITVRSAGGNSRKGLEGVSRVVFHFMSISVWDCVWDIFQEVGGPAAVNSIVLRSSGGMGDCGGPRIPGWHPQRQFRGRPPPPDCLAGLPASEETGRRCQLPEESSGICRVAKSRFVSSLLLA